MNDVDDADLVRAARSGDIAALGALLERYRAQMMAVAVSLLGNHPDTEDVVQDACIQALRRIGDVRDPAGVRGWLIAIVANGCRAPAAPPEAGKRFRHEGITEHLSRIRGADPGTQRRA
jgi:RNA polymerase sigma-70 factor (ECF subfamily)